MNFKKTGLYQQINNILCSLNRWNGSVDLQINYKCTKTYFESVNKVVTWVPQVREWITPPFRSPFLPALLSGQPTVQHSSQPDDSWSQTYLHQCPLTVDSWTTQWIDIVIKVYSSLPWKIKTLIDYKIGFSGGCCWFYFCNIKFCCFISILKNSYAIKKIFFNNIGKIVIKLKKNVLFFNQNTLTWKKKPAYEIWLKYRSLQ